MNKLKKTWVIIIIFLGFYKISYSQNNDLVQLSGIIYNDKDEGLPFVHILIKGQRRGTISDFYGFFSLVINKNDTLILSSIGYKKNFFYIKDTIVNQTHTEDIYLTKDTIMLQEMVVFPWNTYEQFKEAFLKLDAPSDDIDRALKNFALIEEQLKLYPAESDASLNYKYFMQQTYNQLYHAGQLPPNNLLNPFAWAQFFQALRNGDFKRK